MGTKLSIWLFALAVVTLAVVRSDSVLGGLAGRHRTQITFWNGFTGPDGTVMLGIIRRFNEANPDLEVSMQRIDWTTYYNKLMVAALDGRGPQIFVIQSQWLSRMNRAPFIQDLSGIYADGAREQGSKGGEGIPESDFLPITLAQVKFGKAMLGVPLDIWPFGLYYNNDFLKAAGLNQPPRNRSEFLQAAQKMQKPGPDGKPDIWGCALTDWGNNFKTLVPQFDGYYFDSNGKLDLANPGNVADLAFLASLKGPPSLIPPPENQLGWTGFRQQKVGMVIDGIYMVGDLLRLHDFDYRGAPVPVLGNHEGTLADSHILCIRSGISPAEQDGAERFIRFLSKNSVDWAAAGQVPARTSVRQDPKFARMPVQYAFSKELPYIHYPPRTPVIYELNLEIGFAAEKAIRGDATPLQALQTANANVQKYIDQGAEK